MADTLTIKLTGRIDSSNAPQTEASVEQQRAATPHDALVIDLADLQYLSSAGLRIILRLKKAEPSLKLVNASSEVYDIFEMTGFTEMMTIEKAYRRFSVEGCDIIGEGANGTVYRLDRDTIIKVYKKPDALDEIHRERELARKALIMGIPTAIPYDVVEVDGKYGSVFELLNADSFSKLVAQNPSDVRHYIELAADVLVKFHATEVEPDDLPDSNDKMRRYAREVSPLLPYDISNRLLRLVDSIPDCNKMLHGDYHVKNIMMQGGEVLLIDMDTLCHGNPVYEFSGMYTAYEAYTEVRPDSAQSFLGIPQSAADAFMHDTLSIYLGTTDESVIARYRDKAAVLSYMRLMRKFHKAGNADFEEHFRQQLVKLVPTVDSLAY